MSNGFTGYGGSYDSYMDAHHQWSSQNDFSNYRRVKVPAGTNFGYLKTKKDFEIVCGWWNKSYSDIYEKDGGNVCSKVGVKEWDWSYLYFDFNKSDTDNDIINRLACGFQSIWKYYIKGRYLGLSDDTVAQIKEYLEERPRDFFYLAKNAYESTCEDMIEVPFTTSLDEYYTIIESIDKYRKNLKDDILKNIIVYFWNPEVTNISVDKVELNKLIGKTEISAFITLDTFDKEPIIDHFMRYDRNYSKHKKLISILTDNGFEVVPEAELKAKEDEFYENARKKYEIDENTQKAKELKKRNSYKGKWWLVKWSGNWADEIDLEAFSVMNDTEKKKFKKDMNSDDSLNISIGTNEDIETTYREYYDSCEFIEIKDAATREFLLSNCQSSSSWAPHNVWS